LLVHQGSQVMLESKGLQGHLVLKAREVSWDCQDTRDHKVQEDIVESQEFLDPREHKALVSLDLQVSQDRLDHQVLKVIVELVPQESQVPPDLEDIPVSEVKWVQLVELEPASNVHLS